MSTNVATAAVACTTNLSALAHSSHTLTHRIKSKHPLRLPNLTQRRKHGTKNGHRHDRRQRLDQRYPTQRVRLDRKSVV
mgnify:CR=1 FL=1